MRSLQCNITSLLPNTTYKVRVREACESPLRESSATETPFILQTYPGQWTVEVEPSDAVAGVVGVYPMPYRCRLLQNASNASFSLCQTGNLINITRTELCACCVAIEAFWLRDEQSSDHACGDESGAEQTSVLLLA